MKKIIKILVLTTVLMGSMTGCKKENVAVVAEQKRRSAVKSEKASMHIEGMTCAIGCAKTIESKLSGLDGVQKASVDFDNKTATVEYDASLQTSQDLAKTIEGVADGKTYKVSEVKKL